MGITIGEKDALELCRINSEIAVSAFWIGERLDGTKEEIVAVDSVWILFICWRDTVIFTVLLAFLKSRK